MDYKTIKKVVEEYKEQDRAGCMYRLALDKEIDRLRGLRKLSHDKILYMILYKGEYGDYHEFVETIAKELREGE